MRNKKIRLFVGPMSRQVVDLAIEYSNSTGNVLAVIPSRRQIENTGGYVNNWTTKSFSSYVKSNSDTVMLVRDHAGPGQGQNSDDGLDSLAEDIACGFDVIHIDPWKKVASIEEGITKTHELIEYCCSISDNVKFEIGTEEAIFSYSSDDLDKIIMSLKKSLGKKFNRIEYAVIQSGVQISGTENIGNFDPRRLTKMVNVVKKHGLLSKEHNGDYLTFYQIQHRASLGLDSINIAPEFGVAQTRILLKSGLVPFEDAIQACREVNKFSKWIPDPVKDNPPERLIVEVSGHYCFAREPFASSVEKVREKLSSYLFSRFDEIHRAWE